MFISSHLLAREPTSFQTKAETRWLLIKNPLTRCTAAYQGNDLAKCQRERTVPVWLSADHGGTPAAELVVNHKRVARLLREDNLLAVQSPVGL
jgi:hypothetical protein